MQPSLMVGSGVQPLFVHVCTPLSLAIAPCLLGLRHQGVSFSPSEHAWVPLHGSSAHLPAGGGRSADCVFKKETVISGGRILFWLVTSWRCMMDLVNMGAVLPFGSV